MNDLQTLRTQAAKLMKFKQDAKIALAWLIIFIEICGYISFFIFVFTRNDLALFIGIWGITTSFIKARLWDFYDSRERKIQIPKPISLHLGNPWNLPDLPDAGDNFERVK